MKKNLLVTLLCCFTLVFIFSSAVFAEVTFDPGVCRDITGKSIAMKDTNGNVTHILGASAFEKISDNAYSAVDENGNEFIFFLGGGNVWVRAYSAEYYPNLVKNWGGGVYASSELKDLFVVFLAYDGSQFTVWSKDYVADKIKEDTRKAYSDLDPSAWYYTALTALQDADIIKGYEDGKIRPNTNITRAEFVTMLARLDGVDVTQYTSHPYTDAPAEWYKNVIAWAYTEGITNGVTDTAFEPDAKITREAMMVMIARYVEKVHWELPYIETRPFYDDSQISSWARNIIYRLRSISLVEGESRTVDGANQYFITPKSLTTRAEAGTVLYRVMTYEWGD